MVSSYVKLDENERTLVPFQDPSSLETTEREYRNSYKDLHNSLSVALGKLYYFALNYHSLEEWYY